MSELKYLNNSQLLDKLKNRSGGGVELVDTLPPATNYADGALILLQKNILKITDDSFTTLVTASEGDIIGFAFYDVSVDGETMLRGNPEVLIDWGDGTVSTTLDGESPNIYYHTYQAGTYVVKLATKFDLPKVAVALDFGSAIDIVQFGDLQACGYRIGCPNLGSVPATLPVGVTTTEAMFRGCTNFNGVVGGWDTSRITNMYQMFENCSVFNQDLSGWDTSSVTNMGAMFSNCSEFNQNINSWDVSKVVDVSSMFSDCNNFDSPLNSWRLTSVDLMNYLFNGCTNFNQPLDAWTVGSATVMSSIFSGCSTFNQPLNSWDTSSVTDMAYMFEWCTAFNQPLNNWDVGQVEEMAGMFQECSSFDQDISSWSMQIDSKPVSFDTNTPVTWVESKKPAWGQTPTAAPTTIFKLDMTVVPEGASPDKYIFLSSGQNNGPGIGSVGDYWVDWGDGSAIEHLNNSQATHYYSTNSVFLVKITGKVETLSFSAVEWPYDVLQWGDNVADGYSLTGALGSIPTSMPVGITTGYSMFSGCTNFNQDLSGWDTSAFTNMFRMFYHCTNFNQDISGWDVSNVTDMESMFSGCTNFNQPLNNWDVSKVTNMNWMFEACNSFNQPLNNWNVGAVTSLSNTFSGCTNFNQPLNNWDVSNVTEIVGMFKFCTSFNQDLTDWALKPTVSYNDYDYYTPAWLANFKPI